MTLETVVEKIKDKGSLSDAIGSFYDAAHSYSSNMAGYRSNFPALDNTLEGLQKGLILLGGRAHHGKTMWFVNYLFALARNNKDVTVVFFSIDDDKDIIANRLLSMSSILPMKYTKNVNKVYHNPDFTEVQKEMFQKNYANHKRIIENIRNFKLFDAGDGRSLQFILDTAHEIREKHGKIILAIDNFHNISHDIRNENERFSDISGKLKDFATNTETPVICTAKLRKAEFDGGYFRRPNIDQIKNSVDIQFDATVILGIYSHYIATDKASDLYENFRGTTAPIVEIHVLKNKQGDCHKYFYYDLKGAFALVEERDPDTFEEHKAYIDNYKAKNSG